METVDRDKRIIIANIEKYNHKDRIKILQELINMYESEMLIFGKLK